MKFKEWKTQITFIVCFGILISFQNCAVYENEGRIFLDSRSSLSGGEGTESFVGCLPYIADADIQRILGTFTVETRIEVNQQSSRHTCVILGENSVDGLDAYSPRCSIDSAHRVFVDSYAATSTLGFSVDYPSSGEEFERPAQTGTTRSYLRYGKLTTIDDISYYRYVYYGSDSNLSRGVACIFTIRNEGTTTVNLLDTTIEGSARELVDKFLEGISKND